MVNDINYEFFSILQCCEQSLFIPILNLENLEEPQVTVLVQHRIPERVNLNWSNPRSEEFLEFPDPPSITMLDSEVRKQHMSKNTLQNLSLNFKIVLG